MSDLCLLLTADLAAEVRGPTAPGAALAPVLLADGATWVLPESVLDDPAHAVRRPQLAACAMRIVLPQEWCATDPTLLD
ncbi:MAG TPA: hypothetical protein PLK13_21055 [Xanthobacteraceae bacterium]|jgi:hypothetical protein|uniref:hypothetical protein n=1 Tax=Roseixanthobacter finlandensis TaxID=3119922 RepID=UPI000BD9CBCE|nr:MAG: hypothetical protein B7Y61_06370 [Rhizobiales bacterium 35-66-30]OZA97336.1 MAG: hypothetical protein B7X67_23095 [Rhizobiales bacterium 39-66-18]HQS11315.1 hypothetical protein [Xanthobacteraceae bacterium]